MPRFPQPHTCFKVGRATFRFYLGDCLEVLERLPPASIDAIVTSPPYNLGMRYRSYDDTIPRGKYLEWTGQWVRRASAALSEHASLFLNVGSKPTDPWTALDVAQAVRPHLRLQNTIHWIKVDCDREGGHGQPRAAGRGSGGRALQADQQPTVPARLPRIRLSLHPWWGHAARPSGHWRSLPGPVKYRTLAGCRRGCSVPREYVVYSVQDHSKPGEGPAPSGDVPSAAA